jgi:hypothetical protein
MLYSDGMTEDGVCRYGFDFGTRSLSPEVLATTWALTRIFRREMKNDEYWSGTIFWYWAKREHVIELNKLIRKKAKWISRNRGDYDEIRNDLARKRKLNYQMTYCRGYRRMKQVVERWKDRYPRSYWQMQPYRMPIPERTGSPVF